VLWLLGCDPLGPFPDWSETVAVGERIAVSPGELNFPTISVNGQRETRLSFRVTNLGGEPVTVTGHDEVLGGGGTWTVPDQPPLLAVDPDQSVDVEVLFAPPSEGSWTAELVVQPGDERIGLAGAATAPVLEVEDADSIAVVLGCTGGFELTLHNSGSEALDFDAARVTSDEFRVVDLPDSVGPGAADTVGLTFTPASGGTRDASLVLVSNDPLWPELAVSLSALAYEGARVSEEFRYAPSNPTDVLFLVDTAASSMVWYEPAENAAATFVDALRSANVDYHVSSLGSGSPCPTTTPGWTDRYDTAVRSESVVMRGFEAPGGAWDHDLLDLALTALPYSEPGECFEGFRRADADLHLVVVSEAEAPDDLSADLVELAGLAAEDAGFRVSTVVGLGGCAGDADGWAAATDPTGGVEVDLCAQDWTAGFAELADLPAGYDPVWYPLAEVPVPGSIEVRVEGQVFDEWSWDPVENVVRFDGEAVPALGAEVEITYVLAVACTE